MTAGLVVIVNSLLWISTWKVLAGTSGGLLLFSMTLFLTQESKFKSNIVRLVVFVGGVLASIGISVAFAKKLS